MGQLTPATRGGRTCITIADSAEIVSTLGLIQMWGRGGGFLFSALRAKWGGRGQQLGMDFNLVWSSTPAM